MTDVCSICEFSEHSVISVYSDMASIYNSHRQMQEKCERSNT